MKKSLNWFFIIWALLLSLFLLSCPMNPENDNEPAEKPDLTVSLIVHTDIVTVSETWTLGAKISNIAETAVADSSTLKYYLSADAMLSKTEDTLIGSRNIASISAGSIKDDVWSASYSISQEGIWYIFAVADADSEVTESNEGNNTLSVSVTVTAEDPAEFPDLTIASLTVPGTARTTDDSWTLGARVSNIDTANDAPASKLSYFLSSDAALDIPGDELIGSKSIGSIAADNYADDTWSPSYSITEAGTWYIFAVADADSEITESDEENNYLSDSIIINQTGEAPDLTVESITVPGTLQSTTDEWTLGARVSNIDTTTDAPASKLHYYLSNDSELDIPGDTLIGSKALAAIPAGDYIDDIWSDSYSISSGGNWYIFAVADAESEVAENNEGNNTLSGSVQISYDRIVIETFAPEGSGPAFTDTYLALYDSAGDPAPETPYDDTGALAVDDSSNSNHLLYSYIDYTDGLPSGDYYIKVRGSSYNQAGPYGIRVLTEPSAAYSYFGSASPNNDSYEDDGATTGGVPDNPISIIINEQEAWHNRALSENDIDWFILTLD